MRKFGLEDEATTSRIIRSLIQARGFKVKEFKRILFPVDLSESSEKIVPYVQTVAEKFEAKIYILFAARVFSLFFMKTI